MPKVALMRKVLVPAAAAMLIGASISGCSSFVHTRTQGYEIPQSAIKQVRPGQSEDLVVAVLGSPMTTNTFGDEHAYYYVQTRINETSFGLKMVQSRTVLAVYFDKNNKVKDTAVYGLKDGKVVDIETRRTPSYGQDRTFVQSIIASI